MLKTLSHVNVWVHDQDEALAWYTEKLGFEVREDVTLAELGDFRWLTVGLTSVGSFTTSFGKAFGLSPTAYRAAHPPAAERARVPTCVLRAWERPPSRSFREDSWPRRL